MFYLKEEDKLEFDDDSSEEKPKINPLIKPQTEPKIEESTIIQEPEPLSPQPETPSSPKPDFTTTIYQEGKDRGKEEKDDEIVLDFSKITSKIKELFKSEEKADELKEGVRKKSRKDPEADDSINFSQIATKTKTFFKNIKSKTDHKILTQHNENEEEMSFDFKKVTNFTKKNSKWLIPLLFILIAISLSTYLRMMPSSLPITEDWAENTVHNFYKNQLEAQVNQQYPNLPEQNRKAIVEKEFQNILESNHDQIIQDINRLSEGYKAHLQDENGDTYLLAIDPYLWYSQSRNVVDNGHLGDKIIHDPEEWYGQAKNYLRHGHPDPLPDEFPVFTLRDGRLDKKANPQLHPYIGAYLYKILHLFNSNISLMWVLFLLPVIFINLSLIPTFFIGRKIAGNVGGLFAAIFLAINGPLLARTPAGFADTDPYSIFFPLMISWLFLEAYTTKRNTYRIAFSILGGFFVGLYAFAWTGWAHIFLFILASIFIIVVLKLSLAFVKNNYQFSSNLLKKIQFKEKMIILITFFISSGIFVTYFKNWWSFHSFFSRLIGFTTLKEVGIKSIWPNVLTTVAEFNTISFENIINQMGGQLFFYAAILGILLTLLKRNKEEKREYVYFFLLALWFVGTSYSFTKGARFAILMAPPFALSLGSIFGFIYEKGSHWIDKGIHLDKNISRILIIIILALFIISPLNSAQNVAKNEIPSMNDQWYNTLNKIKDASEDGIITSWWDFGHWFVAIAERRVTFDGGDQGERIHWVGRTLRTDDEQEAVGILRMMNCAQETAPHKLDEFTDDSLKSIKILYEIFQINDRNDAKKKYQELGLTAEEAEIMLEYTHCQDLLPNYYITSEDMVGKAGVWGHFGSWDFEKATMYQNTKKLSREEAITYLTNNFDLNEEEADRIHSEILTTKGDRWISPWPGYLSGWQNCDPVSENEIKCVGSVQGGNFVSIIDLQSFNVSFEGNLGISPDSLVYLTERNVEEKEFSGQKVGFSIVLTHDEEDNYKMLVADPLQAASMFTKLFFFEGHGLKCFSKFDDVQQFTGGRIITWEVDYDCRQDNDVFFNQEVIVEENLDTETSLS